MTQTICTDRLILRRWQETDLLPFSTMNTDPQVMEYFPKTLTKEESDAFVRRIEAGFETNGYGLWAVELQKTGQFIGFIGFSIPGFQADFTPCIEIGWRIAYEHWGQGYASEGAMACLEYGFEALHFSEVFSFTAAINQRSSRVMEKIGMVQVGQFAHPRIASSDPLCLHVLYRIDQGMWARRTN